MEPHFLASRDMLPEMIPLFQVKIAKTFKTGPRVSFVSFYSPEDFCTVGWGENMPIHNIPTLFKH